ncbi:hypothetical protein [Nocardiopsis kunsanensis]|nr:hypothetical protein [Nocardiopsis kunsanensis]
MDQHGHHGTGTGLLVPGTWMTATLLGIAAHNILAKTIYAVPPDGVPLEQARAGAELMYYAGAPVEIALLFLVCRPWLLPRRGRESAHSPARPQTP